MHEETAKKEKRREKSFVREMNDLKREIDEEIRREIHEGKLDGMFSATNKRTNITLNVGGGRAAPDHYKALRLKDGVKTY